MIPTSFLKSISPISITRFNSHFFNSIFPSLFLFNTYLQFNSTYLELNLTLVKFASTSRVFH